MPRGYCHRHGAAQGPCSCSLGRLSRLVEPTILFLLASGRGRYGYDLMEELRAEAMTDSQIDPGIVYRTLRQLEGAGCVVSQWGPGESGPQRRVYQITAIGRAHLGDWVAVMARRAEQMLAFVGKCGQLDAAGQGSTAGGPNRVGHRHSMA